MRESGQPIVRLALLTPAAWQDRSGAGGPDDLATFDRIQHGVEAWTVLWALFNRGLKAAERQRHLPGAQRRPGRQSTAALLHRLRHRADGGRPP